MTLGVIGAGRIGLAVAGHARAAGMDVTVAASADPARIAAAVATAAPGAQAGRVPDAAAADVVVLAIPMRRLGELDARDLDGVLVVDAMNHWWELDGDLPELTDPRTSTSEVVQRRLAGARIVKSLNHLGAYALENLARPAGARDRLGVAVAGDRDDDVATVIDLVDALGFAPVKAGALAEGVRFEPGTELFGADVGAAEAQQMLERFWDSQRGRVVARARA